MLALLRVAECLSTHTSVVQVPAVYMVQREGTKTFRKTSFFYQYILLSRLRAVVQFYYYEFPLNLSILFPFLHRRMVCH